MRGCYKNGLVATVTLSLAGTAGTVAANDISRQVQHGDTLSAIALEEYGTAILYREIYEANRDQLASPDHLIPGMTLTIPADPDGVDRVAGPISLATSGAYEPFADPALDGGGFTVRIAEEAFERAGYDVEVNTLDTWPSVEEGVETHEQDAAVPYAMRETGFIFTDPVYDLSTQFFVMQDDPPISAQWEDSELDELTVCKPEGYFTEDIQDFLDDGLLDLVRGDETVASCFQKVERGDADLFAVNPYTGWKTLHEDPDLNESDFAEARRSAGPAPMRIMVAEDHPQGAAIVSAVNEALGVLDDRGVIDEETNEGLTQFYRDVLAHVDRTILDDDIGAGAGESIVLRTGNNYEPFADEELPEGGMSSEVIRTALTQAFDDPDLDIAHVAWPDAEEAVLEGDADGAYPYVVEREQSGVLFSEPLNGMPVHVFVSDDHDLQEYRGRSDLDGMWACKPEGYYTSDLQDLIDDDRIQLVTADSDDPVACFEMLEEGQVDFVSFNPFVADSAIERSGYEMDDFRDLGGHYNAGLGVMVRDDADGREFVDYLNEALAEMNERGDISGIVERHIQWYLEE